MFFGETTLAIARDLQPRLCLRFFDLRARTRFSRRFLSVLGLEQGSSRFGNRFRTRAQRLGERSTLLVETDECFSELISSRRQTVGEGISLLHLAMGPLATTIELALTLRGTTRIDLRGLECA